MDEKTNPDAAGDSDSPMPHARSAGNSASRPPQSTAKKRSSGAQKRKNTRKSELSHQRKVLQAKSIKARKGSRYKRGVGALRRVAQEAERRYPRDLHRQINHILWTAQVPAAFGRARTVSDKTCADLGKELHRLPGLLRELRMPVHGITHIGRKHVIALCRHWQRESLSAKTIGKYVSTIRRFLDLVGKRGSIPEGAEWLRLLDAHEVDTAALRVHSVARLPKGWKALGADPLPVIAAIRAEDRVVGCQMAVMFAFGLRVNEAAQLIPEDSDKGDHLMVWRGTKGGKERRVDFSSNPEKRAAQRRVLDEAAALAAAHPKRCLAIPGLSLKAMKNRMHYLARKHGLTAKALGVTLHGLRHQFALDLFEELSGLPAPVLGLVDPHEYTRNEDKVREAMQKVSRQMGHERASICGAYIGSASGQQRAAQKRILELLRKLEQERAVFKTMNAEEAWLVGRCAQGLPLHAGDQICVAVRFRDGGDVETNLVRSGLSAIGLQRDLASALNQPVRILIWTDTSRPGGAVEIII